MNGFTFCFCFYYTQNICCLDRFKNILELYKSMSKSEYSTICWSDNGLFIWKPYVHFFAIREIWISRKIFVIPTKLAHDS